MKSDIQPLAIQFKYLHPKFLIRLILLQRQELVIIY